MIKFIDTIYYFYFKKEEKDFGRNIWSAISAACIFAGQAFISFFIINGILINWEPYDHFLLIIPAFYAKLLIASPFIFWTAYFLFRKRYLRIVEHPEIYDTPKNRFYFKLSIWVSCIGGFLSTIIGFGIKYGF